MGSKVVLVAFVFVVALSGEPSAGLQKGDPRWNRPYQMSNLDWLVLQSNVYNARDCEKEGLVLFYFTTPNIGINITVHARKAANHPDDSQWECIAQLLASLQS